MSSVFRFTHQTQIQFLLINQNAFLFELQFVNTVTVLLVLAKCSNQVIKQS
jgi:hypothetical protein